MGGKVGTKHWAVIIERDAARVLWCVGLADRDWNCDDPTIGLRKRIGCVGDCDLVIGIAGRDGQRVGYGPDQQR